MKTQEEIVRKHAVGAINIYGIYKEGYNDRKSDEEDRFRREAAKDILCAMVSHSGDEYSYIERAVFLADELIKQLKEDKK